MCLHLSLKRHFIWMSIDDKAILLYIRPLATIKEAVDTNTVTNDKKQTL